ncbi:NUDIX domain-containing protein [Exiguobacterium undae]|uniref:NUDIX domain-containing protein n=1 Tax=Exiguobacterium undae TaxID=169177 RepID=UPI00385102D1
MRHRACAALIENGRILMVRLETNDRSFWTLPGGGLEEHESFEQAVIREVQEEVNLRVSIRQRLYTNRAPSGQEVCFLVERIDASKPVLGRDPERSTEKQILSEVKWCSLVELEEDVQISKILRALKKISHPFC